MDCFCHHTFASTALTGDQHSGENTSNLVNHVTNPLDGFAVAEQSLDASNREGSLFCYSELANDRRTTTTAIDRKPQLLNVKRLLQEVDGAFLKNLACSRGVLGPSKTDNRCS